MFQLIESAQNKQMSPRVIGESIGGIENLKPVLFDFEPKMICSEYPIGSEKKLFNEIVEKIKPKGKMRNAENSIWPQFLKSITTGAKFIESFKNIDIFKETVEKFNSSTRERAAFAYMISLEVFGIGFPLACDFLKELGYKEFSKADVHTKRIILELNLYDGVISNQNENYFVFLAMNRIAENNGISPFVVDKLLWIIGGGEFYNHKKIILKIGKNRNKFIAYCKNND
jgi:thermostable 8-oxoguanine DNA glycosylase